jgi:hypothetical protein
LAARAQPHVVAAGLLGPQCQVQRAGVVPLVGHGQCQLEHRECRLGVLGAQLARADEQRLLVRGARVRGISAVQQRNALGAECQRDLRALARG